MIIVGYPCIGKSTYAAGHPYRAIDLESSNFVKDDNWVKSYCNVAIDLSCVTVKRWESKQNLSNFRKILRRMN